MNADCLDRSDEPLIVFGLTGYKVTIIEIFFMKCSKDPGFRCEDHMYHPSAYKNYTLECGDGSRFDFEVKCTNNRHLNFGYAFWFGTKISDNCIWNIECFTQMPWYDYLRESCSDFPIKHAKSIEQYWDIIVYYLIPFEDTSADFLKRQLHIISE